MPVRRLDEIYIPADRVRKVIPPESIEELAKSILEVGLMHPPVVEADGALLAGERRYRALCLIAERGLTYHSNGKFMSNGLVMTTDIRDLTRSQRLQAEIEENTVRLDISWQEKAEAIAALHKLRELQKQEQSIPGLPSATQSVAETAAEVKGKPVAEITRYEAKDIQADLVVQAWMTNHPDDTQVSGAKTRVEALKIIETRLEDEHRVALARRFLSHRPDSGHIVKLADCCSILPDTPDGLYDCILTDPPWGAGANTWDNGGATRRHSYLDDIATFERIHRVISKEGYRIAKPKAHLYLFCSFQHFAQLSAMFRTEGWDVWPRPLIWFRGPQSGIAPRPEHGPKNTYECILFANKGDKRTLKLLPDVVGQPKSNDPRAAAKPTGVYYDLLSRSCLPGDEVLDPCCGTAPLIPAATALKLRATCYDIAEDAIGIASQRLTETYQHEEYAFGRVTTGSAKRAAKLATV